MIFRFLYKISGPRQFVVLLLFALGGLGLFFSFKAYTKGSTSQVEDFSFEKTKDFDIELQDLRATLDWEGKVQEDYNNIVADNLFSPDREAWQPPESKDKDEEPKKNDKTRRRHYDHDKVRLYGTSLSAKFKNALIYFGQFQDKRKYRQVNEKEQIYEDNEQEDFFEVRTIKNESVVLVDPNGEEFTVGLYDHQRKKQKTKDSGKSQPTILIGGQEPEPETEQDKPESEGPDKEVDKNKDDDEEEKEEKEEENKSTNPFKRMIDSLKNRDKPEENNEAKGPEALQDLGGADTPDNKSSKEELVEQGKLRKIETPFGVIYRPVK